jgi:uncharacterized protein YaaN involved in tellurite resistance
MKILLNISFDLSVLENRKAMKEFGIDNRSWLFTKLFESGISNFQDLLSKYQSLDDIVVRWLGKSWKKLLSDIMKYNNLSFGMDISHTQ